MMDGHGTIDINGMSFFSDAKGMLFFRDAKPLKTQNNILNKRLISAVCLESAPFLL